MVVRDLDDGDVCVVANNVGIEHDDRVIASASSYHITSNRDCFSTYKPMRSGTVYLIDNIEYQVVGIRMVRVKLFDGSVVTLYDICHIPSLKKN